MMRRGPVWEFADRLHIRTACFAALWPYLVLPVPSRRPLRRTCLRPLLLRQPHAL